MAWWGEIDGRGLFFPRTEDGGIERGRSGGAGRLGELGLVVELRTASPFYRRGGQ